MTERSRHAWRIGALAAGVFAAHVALLQGAPRIGGGRERTGAWAVRLVPVATAAAANPSGPVAAASMVGDTAKGARRTAPDHPSTKRSAATPRSQSEARARRDDRPVDETAAPDEMVAQATGPSPAATVPNPVLAAPNAAPASAPPIAFRVMPSARLHYLVVAQAKGFELHGTGELDWRHDGNGYEARLELASPPLPRRMQQSTGTIGAGGLEPVRFADRIRSEKAAHFQREQGKISFSNNQPDVPLEPGAQDRLSVILQLGAMVAGDPRRFGAGTAIAVQTASVSDAEVWTFTVEGEERLQLPGGNVTGLKLVRNPRKDFDTKVELWLAPGMDYAPIRLRLTQPNGDWVDQQWSSTDRS